MGHKRWFQALRWRFVWNQACCSISRPGRGAYTHILHTYIQTLEEQIRFNHITNSVLFLQYIHTCTHPYMHTSIHAHTCIYVYICVWTKIHIMKITYFFIYLFQEIPVLYKSLIFISIMSMSIYVYGSIYIYYFSIYLYLFISIMSIYINSSISSTKSH